MVHCELCGRESELVIVDIEGTELNVCSSCATYGQVRKRVIPSQFQQTVSRRDPLPEHKVIDDYAGLIRKARETKGMSHNDFSKLLNERETLISKWESGGLKPSLDTARKLEKVLGIKLLQEEVLPAVISQQRSRKEELTLGDFAKVRKRK